MTSFILLAPLSAKYGLSLSHLVPEIIGPKVCLISHQNHSFDGFESLCTNFLLDFWSRWPYFSLFLNLFDASFLQVHRSNWVHFFIAWLTPYQIFVEVPLRQKNSYYLEPCVYCINHLGILFLTFFQNFKIFCLNHFLNQFSEMMSFKMSKSEKIYFIYRYIPRNYIFFTFKFKYFVQFCTFHCIIHFTTQTFCIVVMLMQLCKAATLYNTQKCG